jgi:hypothetical protein
MPLNSFRVGPDKALRLLIDPDAIAKFGATKELAAIASSDKVKEALDVRVEMKICLCALALTFSASSATAGGNYLSTVMKGSDGPEKYTATIVSKKAFSEEESQGYKVVSKIKFDTGQSYLLRQSVDCSFPSVVDDETGQAVEIHVGKKGGLAFDQQYAVFYAVCLHKRYKPTLG